MWYEARSNASFHQQHCRAISSQSRDGWRRDHYDSLPISATKDCGCTGTHFVSTTLELIKIDYCLKEKEGGKNIVPSFFCTVYHRQFHQDQVYRDYISC